MSSKIFGSMVSGVGACGVLSCSAIAKVLKHIKTANTKVLIFIVYTSICLKVFSYKLLPLMYKRKFCAMMQLIFDCMFILSAVELQSFNCVYKLKSKFPSSCDLLDLFLLSIALLRLCQKIYYCLDLQPTRLCVYKSLFEVVGSPMYSYHSLIANT